MEVRMLLRASNRRAAMSAFLWSQFGWALFAIQLVPMFFIRVDEE